VPSPVRASPWKDSFSSILPNRTGKDVASAVDLYFRRCAGAAFGEPPNTRLCRRSKSQHKCHSLPLPNRRSQRRASAKKVVHQNRYHDDHDEDEQRSLPCGTGRAGPFFAERNSDARLAIAGEAETAGSTSVPVQPGSVGIPAIVALRLFRFGFHDHVMLSLLVLNVLCRPLTVNR